MYHEPTILRTPVILNFNNMYNILLKWVYLHGDNNLSIFICSLLDRFTARKAAIGSCARES